MSRQHAHRSCDWSSESSLLQRKDYRRCSSPALDRMPSDSYRWSTKRSEQIDYENRLHRSSLPEPEVYSRDSIVNERSNSSILSRDRPFHSNSPFHYRGQPGSDHNHCSRSPFGEPSSWFHERRKSPGDVAYPRSDCRSQESQRKSHNHGQHGSRSSLPSNTVYAGVDSLPYYGGHSPVVAYARSRSPHYSCNARTRSRSPFDSWPQHHEYNNSGLLTRDRRPLLHDEEGLRRRPPSIRDRSPSPSFEKGRTLPRPYIESHSDCANCGRSKSSQYDRLSSSYYRSEFGDRSLKDFSAESHNMQRQKFVETGASLTRCRSRELLDRDTPGGNMANDHYADVDYRLARGNWFDDEDLRLRSGGVTDNPPTGYDCDISEKTWQRRSPAGEERRRRPSSDLRPAGHRVKDEHADRSKIKPKPDQKLQYEKSVSTNPRVVNQTNRDSHTEFLHDDNVAAVCNKLSNTYRGDNKKRQVNQGLENASVESIETVLVARSRAEVRGDSFDSGNTSVLQHPVITDTDMRQSSMLGKRAYIADAQPQNTEVRVSQSDSVDVRSNESKLVNKTDADYRKFPSSRAKMSYAEVCNTTKTSSDVTHSDVNGVKRGSPKVANVHISKGRSARLESKSSGVNTGVVKSSASVVDLTNSKSRVYGIAVVGSNKLKLQSLAENYSKASATAATAVELPKKFAKLVGEVPLSGPVNDLKSETLSNNSQRSVKKLTAGLSLKKISDVCGISVKTKPDAVDNKNNKPKVKSLIMAVPVCQSKKKQVTVNVAQRSVCSAVTVSETDAKNVKKSEPRTVKTSALASSVLLKRTDTTSKILEILPVLCTEKPAVPGITSGKTLFGDTRTVKQKAVEVESSVMPTADKATKNGSMLKEVRRIVLRRPNVEGSKEETADNKLDRRRRRWRSNVELSSEAGVNLPSTTLAENAKNVVPSSEVCVNRPFMTHVDHPKRNHETEVPSIANESLQAFPDYADDLDDVSSVDSCQTELRLDLSELADDAFDDDLPRIRFDKTKSTRDLEEGRHCLETRKKPPENYNGKASRSAGRDDAGTFTTVESTISSSDVKTCCVGDGSVPSYSVAQTEIIKVPLAAGSVQPLMSLSCTKGNRATASLLHRSSRRSKSKSPRNVSNSTRQQFSNSTAANHRSKSVRGPAFLGFGEVRRSMYKDALHRSRYGASQLAHDPFTPANFNEPRPHPSGDGRSTPGLRPMGRRTKGFARPWQTRL